MSIKYIALILLLFVWPAWVSAVEPPPLAGRVNDRARLLSPATAQILEQKLADFERDTSNQVVILTVPSLQGDDIDRYAIRVAEVWKIGQKGRDNGVLLLIAQAERKVRIEVGMGLQGVLPDITASRIIRDVMREHLKSGNFDQGISAGVESIIAATKGEFTGKGDTASRRRPAQSSLSPAMILVGAVIAIAVSGMISRFLGGSVGAVGVPLAFHFAFPGFGVITLLLLGVAGLFAGLLLSMMLSGKSGGGYGGFGGGWGGGFYGGGGSSGGDDGFSGGGGDFDGGGSSDDY